MGVDISLHIEIRKEEKWHLMTIDSPLLRQDYEYDIFRTQVFNCRYYHFRHFLESAQTHIDRKIEILSEELQKKLENDDDNMGFGVFMFDELVNHCDTLEKELLSNLTNAGIYAIREQLNRIGQKLENGTTDKKSEMEEESNEERITPIEQVHDDFMWENGCIFGLRDTVLALTSIGFTHISHSDIRIFYLIC